MEKAPTGIPENVKQVITAAAPILVVIVLFLIVGKFGISKVIKVQSEIKSAQKVEKTLTQKLNLLKTLSADISLKSGFVTTAVPDSNPSLATISQMKTLAVENGVVLSGIKSSGGAQGSSGLNESLVNFSIEGARAQVFVFLDGLANISPITVADKVRFSETAGLVKADLSVKSYWAPYPKTIPSVTTPIVDLTSSEKNILTRVSSLTQPIFVGIQPSGEVNLSPFGE
jgi:hypothetical protein